MIDASRPPPSSPRAGPGCASQNACSPDRASSRGRPEGVANARPVPRKAASGAGNGECPCPGGSRADGMPHWSSRRLPAGGGRVANDSCRAGVQGSAERRPAPAGSPWRVREGSASPERRAAPPGSGGDSPRRTVARANVRRTVARAA